ncbi:MAG TPA: DUF6350 family protein [Pseudolysinimonas sp.]|nr:DUF6350 family protein [Pseudolysinimonas sp.]
MTRRFTALLAALEAVFVVAIGVAIPLVPLTIVWAAHFGFGPDWVIFWRGAADAWLLGHGVDVTFTLDPATAAQLAVPGAGNPVPVTIAALGFALLTVLLGIRAGARIAESGHARLGGLVAFAVFAVLSLVVVLTAVHPLARPSIWQGVLLPTVVFGVGLALGGRTVPTSWLTERMRRWPQEVRAAVPAALRAGATAASATLLVSAVAVAALIAVHYADVLRLYEALHTEVVGGIAITAAQLALLPDFVVWAAAWFTGPGFAIGTASQVSPLGTALGPIPTIPLFGALPTGDSPLAFIALLVPIIAGFFAGFAARPALVRALERVPVSAIIGTAAGGGLTGGLILGLLAWAASGSAGPGRLVTAGPDPLAVGIAATVEFGLAILAGLAAASRRTIGQDEAARQDETAKQAGTGN